MPSLGQTEQERAFQAVLDDLGRGKKPRLVHYFLPEGNLRKQMMAIFVAGEQRGQELRGCCSDGQQGEEG